MNHVQALAYVRCHHHGVLATTHNVRRDPRVAMTVIGDNWYECVVVEGTARIINEDVLPLLRHVSVAIAGTPHPTWPSP